MMPICVKPYHDELLYGWMVRLMDCNGAINMKKFQNMYFKKWNSWKKNDNDGKPRLDWILGMERICREHGDIRSFPKLPEMIKNMTVTFSVFPFLSYGYQALRSQIMLRDDDLYKIAPDSDVERLCICPECMREDMENCKEAYYHVWHHLSGVRVCVKHRLPLKEVRHNWNENLWNPKTVQKASEIQLLTDLETECMISRFMKEMHENPLAVNLKTLQKVMIQEMKRRGYQTEMPYGNLPDDIKHSGFVAFFGENVPLDIRRILVGSWINREKAIALLVFLFREYKAFYKTASEQETDMEPEFRELALAKDLEVLSYHGYLSKLQCRECGNMFHIHPYALALGCGCPVCDGMLPTEEFVKRQMSLIGNGQYEFAEPFQGYGTKIRIKHRTCGRERVMRPADLIWMQTECKCGFEITEEKLQERIDPGGKEFKLIHYFGKWGKGQIVTIRHETCGGEFDIQLSYFEKNPYCRICRPRNYTTDCLKKDMKKLTGDEYEMITPFVDQKAKIRVLHKPCGTYTDGLPAGFLNGKRCRLCSKSVTEAEIREWVKECTDGKYEVTGYENGMFEITGADGNTFRKNGLKIMQELTRPTPSKLFPERIRPIKVPTRTAADIYIKAKQICEKQGSFGTRDFPEYETVTLRNSMKWLSKNGYLERIGRGKYIPSEQKT